MFRLVSEAHRIRLAHLFDPVLAVHTSLVEPLPHQITAVYELIFSSSATSASVHLRPSVGDILPLSPLARSLVMLEALVGQLFPVVLIARLVAMEIEHQRGTRQH